MLNTENKGSFVNSGLLSIRKTTVPKVNLNKMCQKNSENLYSLYVEEIRIFCNLEVQESEFVFIASKEKSLKAVTP